MESRSHPCTGNLRRIYRPSAPFSIAAGGSHTRWPGKENDSRSVSGSSRSGQSAESPSSRSRISSGMVPPTSMPRFLTSILMAARPYRLVRWANGRRPPVAGLSEGSRPGTIAAAAGGANGLPDHLARLVHAGLGTRTLPIPRWSIVASVPNWFASPIH
jgi:hypothetical protein